jgi:hypothetical protein
MKYWMRKLAEHHKTMRRRYPEERIIVVFDVDDTILDLRHMILYVLRSFDRCHNTAFFVDLTLEDVEVSEMEVRRMIGQLPAPAKDKRRIMKWVAEHSWSSEITRAAHRPFPGVMEVIRWLQRQSKTFVGLNTGRPELIRHDTLYCLKKLGRPHKARFDNDLLFMNPCGWNENIVAFKVAGIDYFRKKGFRVIAFIDNEPENLEAISMFDRTGDILLLHADTFYNSERARIPSHAVSGSVYDVKELRRPDGSELGEAA